MVRMISLSPSLTEIICALNASHSLIGASDPCELDEKKIGSLSPDWILADARDHRPEEIRKLQKKWRVKLFEVRKVEEVCDVVAELGRLVEKREEANRLNQAIEDEMRMNQKVFQDRERKRTALLLWNVPLLTVNFDAYPSHLVERSGGANVFREEPLREFPVELEDMIEKDPEILLLASAPAPFRPKHIARFRQYRIFSHIPIHLIEGGLLSRYGVETVKALRFLRKIYEGLL